MHGKENMPLQREDKERLGRIIDFAEAELKDLKDKFLNLNFNAYNQDSDKRRSLERCIENIVNASLDIAKIILVGNGLPIPDKYKDYFINLSNAELINGDIAKTIADCVKLRNILAHQYLDIRWESIKRFLSRDWIAYEKFIDSVKDFLIREAQN